MISAYSDILKRIEAAISDARAIFARFTPGAIDAEFKAGHDPVTEADRAIDAVLRQNLLRDGEGWLSEESVDDLSRLEKTRVWVVDPLDGTREFVKGIPEFCVSIGYVENGHPVAGGILQSSHERNFPWLHRLRRPLQRQACPDQPACRATGSRDARQPQRGEARRMEAVRTRPAADSGDGIGCLQAGAGVSGSGRHHVHADPEERVGCRGRRRSGPERGWLCRDLEWIPLQRE